MEENKKLLNALTKKNPSFKSKTFLETNQFESIIQNFKVLINDPIFENISMGQNEWVNIQTVIRTALNTLHQGLIQQSESVSFLSQNCSSKRDFEELYYLLSMKHDTKDFKKTIEFVSEKIQSKAETKDLENLENSFLSKSSFIDYQKIQSKKQFEFENSLLSKASMKDLSSSNEQCKSEISQIRIQMKAMEEEISNLKNKMVVQQNSSDAFDVRLKNNETILKDLKPILQNCVSKNEMIESLSFKADEVL